MDPVQRFKRAIDEARGAALALGGHRRFGAGEKGDVLHALVVLEGVCKRLGAPLLPAPGAQAGRERGGMDRSLPTGDR
ncbi:hypothetical protein [Desulfocurvus sp.]|uniref:hypothetical protein n=1 Tax=Desulfocurvus sp. TaxID=2871698 RepID=UPI0025B8DF50|nr:hypothetical protein [Desulfocurvus sp.]MCK9240222.1 hypothetical protein [Desulfocurvus sp.]